MTKHSEMDMTRLIGKKHDPESAAAAVKELMGEVKGLQATVVIVDEIAVMTPEQWASLGMKTAPANPNRVRCPLCRRINTVSLVAVSAGKQSTSDFRCSYDGCRGLEWSQ